MFSTSTKAPPMWQHEGRHSPLCLIVGTSDYWGRIYSPPEVDRIWGISGSCHNIPKAIFYLLKGDYKGIISGYYSTGLYWDNGK